MRAASHAVLPEFAWPRRLASRPGSRGGRRTARRVEMILHPPGSAAASPRSAFSAQLRAVAAQQDREAFAALFGHFAPRIKSYVLRLGADALVAEDLAQETMLAVWRKAGQFDPAKAEASTWIFAIARNLRIDALRRERRPEIDERDPLLAPEAVPRADDALSAAQVQAQLRAALAALPAEQAEVVRLSFFADKPHREIERELGIPLGTVKSRLRLAMRHIRAVLGEEP